MPNEAYKDFWDTFESVFRARLDMETREAWEFQLSNFSRESIFRAVTDVCRSEDKMPSLAKLMQYARKFMPDDRIRFQSGHDSQGIACVFWSDEPTTPAYRAVNCKEGRNFLVQLAKVSGKTPEQMATYMEKWVGQSEV